MAKALGSWSGMRRYLEREMLAESLAGRVRYGCTHYTGMDNDRVFTVAVDGRTVKRFSLETVNDFFLKRGRKSVSHPADNRDYWADFWRLLEETPAAARPEFTDREFAEALAEYRRQDVQTSLAGANPLVRMFAILDRRAGRRTLEREREGLDGQPEWLRPFYRLRLEAEGLLQTEERKEF